MSIKVGENAPEFCLPSSNGDTFCLKDYKGKKIVLYFYPKDMTPGCTTEACDFRDRTSEFAELNTIIVGISMDSITRHGKFIEKHQLPFQLLSDENHEVCEAYGVWQEKKMMGKTYMGIVRSTFIIDETGKIARVFSKVRVKNHIEEILQQLSEK